MPTCPILMTDVRHIKGIAADSELGNRHGTAQAVAVCGGGRLDPVAGIDTLYDARDLSLHGHRGALFKLGPGASVGVR